jgi:hypothetical protein
MSCAGYQCIIAQLLQFEHPSFGWVRFASFYLFSLEFHVLASQALSGEPAALGIKVSIRGIVI